MLFGFTVLFLATVSLVSARPDGAPAKACGDLLPQHRGNAVQEDEPPYLVEVKSTHVHSLKTADVTDEKNVTAPSIKVSISGDEEHKFKGFILVAHDADGKAIGTFEIPQGEKSSKTLDCAGASKSAVTHSNKSAKVSAQFLWTPPLDFEGSIHFSATVVKDFKTFYSGIKSSDVTVTAL